MVVCTGVARKNGGGGGQVNFVGWLWGGGGGGPSLEFFNVMKELLIYSEMTQINSKPKLHS